LPEEKIKKREFWWRIKALLLTAILIMFIGAAGYWLYFSSFWEIRAVEVVGLNKINQEEFSNQLKSQVASNNFWSWPSGDFSVKDFPLLASIYIDKHFLKRSITINAQEREAMGIWCFYPGGGQECYWFDEGGIIFEQAPKSASGLIITVEDVSANLRAAIGEILIDKSLWTNLKAILDSWLLDDLNVAMVALDRFNKELTMENGSGFKVLFSLKFDPRLNLAALKKARDDGLVNFNRLGYADLRVENRIYYK